MDLILQRFHVGELVITKSHLAFEVLQTTSEKIKIIQSILVLDLSFVQDRVLDLDLLIQKRQLIISSNQL